MIFKNRDDEIGRLAKYIADYTLSPPNVFRDTHSLFASLSVMSGTMYKPRRAVPTVHYTTAEANRAGIAQDM